MRLLIQLIVVTIFFGCAGPSQMTVPSGKDGRLIEYGFDRKAFSESQKNGQGRLFFRLKESDGIFKVTEVASIRLLPRSKEEILVFLSETGQMLPAYASASYFGGFSGTTTETFHCAPFFRHVKSEYHPCGSGSKLVSISAGVSLYSNFISLITSLGLASGVDYGVNSSLLAQITREQRLLEIADELQELHRYAKKAEREKCCNMMKS